MALQEEFKLQGDFLFRYRGYLPLLILGLGYGVFVYGLQHDLQKQGFWWTEYYTYLCLSIGLFGLFIRCYTVGYTPDRTSGRNTKEGQVADVLNTSGIYSMVRHPLYVGNFFMWIAIALLARNVWFIAAFIMLYIVYYERIIFAEESFLRKKFSTAYLNWAEKTPAVLPNLRVFKSPHHRFRLKKVLKKEKNGLAALFILFWIFEITEVVIGEQKWVLELEFWSIAALGATLIYLILKLLKMHNVLDDRPRQTWKVPNSEKFD